MVKSAPPPPPGQCTLLGKSGVGDNLNSQFIGKKTAPCGGTTGVSCDLDKKAFGGFDFRAFDYENSFTFWGAAAHRPYATPEVSAIVGKQYWGPISVWMQNIVSTVFVTPKTCNKLAGFNGGFAVSGLSSADPKGVIGVVMNVDSANKAETGTDFGCIFPTDGKVSRGYVRGAPNMSPAGPLKDRVSFFKTGEEAVNPESPAFAVAPRPGFRTLDLACGSCDCDNKNTPECAYTYNDFCTGTKSGKDKNGNFVGSFCVAGDLNVPSPPKDVLNNGNTYGISCSFAKGSDPQAMFDKQAEQTKNYGQGYYAELPLQQVQGSRGKSVKAFLASASLIGKDVKANEYKFRMMQQCNWWNRLQKTNVPLLSYDNTKCTDGPEGLCGPFIEEMECFKDTNNDGKGLPYGDSFSRIELLESVFNGMWDDKPSEYKCITSLEDPRDASKESAFKAGSVKVQVRACGLIPGAQFDLNTQRWIFSEVGKKTDPDKGTIPYGNIKLDGKWCLTHTDDGTPDDGDDFTAEECLDDQRLKDLKKQQHWVLDADFGAIIAADKANPALDFGVNAKAITFKGLATGSGLLLLQPATNGALTAAGKVANGVSDPKTGYKMYENQRWYAGMMSRHSWDYK